jgi:hypothetical protein
MGLGGTWAVLRTPRSAGSSTGWLPHLLPDHPWGLELLGAAALLVPRLPRLKEWAYAGAVFNYTGAAASHLAAGKADPGTLVFLLAPTGLTAASWALRAPARRDLASSARGPGRLDSAGRKTVTDPADTTSAPAASAAQQAARADAILRVLAVITRIGVGGQFLPAGAGASEAGFEPHVVLGCALGWWTLPLLVAVLACGARKS